MDQNVRLDKDVRRAHMADVLRQDPGKTDQSLAALFGVSVATIRLDRRMMGIPQMKERLEAAIHPEKPSRDMEIISLEKGKVGLALLHTAEEGNQKEGFIPAERLYGLAAKLAALVVGEPFAPTQVGNIKYKKPVSSGERLVAQAKVTHMRGTKQYIYVTIATKDTEIFRAKFIMNVIGHEGEENGKNSG